MTEHDKHQLWKRYANPVKTHEEKECEIQIDENAMLCIELVDGRKIEMHAARGGELVIRRE